MPDLIIKKISCPLMEKGELIMIDQYLVCDESEKSIDGVLHKTEEAAEAVVTNFAKLAIGLEYARMRYPGIAEKSQKAKANVIADYFLWEEEGKPLSVVKEKKVAAPSAEEMPEVPEEGTGEDF